MRTVAYFLLTCAVAALAMMIAAFLLAMFGDLLGPKFAEREWGNIGLPMGMAALFFFGVGGAVAREVTVREELDRSMQLLREELDRALKEAGDARELLQAAMPAVDRFRRAAATAQDAAPTELVNLADLVVFEDGNPAQAAGYLQDLRQALGKKAPAKPKPAAASGQRPPRKA